MLIMVLDHRFHYFNTTKHYLSLLAYPIQLTVDAPFRLGEGLQNYFKFHYQLAKENQQLRNTQLQLQAQLQQFDSLKAENTQLRDLLQATARREELFRVADVLRIEADPFAHRILINKGLNNGVYQGQTLINEHGIMGEVIEVHPQTSQAILITDASHALPVEVLRNGVRGIVAGTGTIDKLALQYIATNADVKVGDKLVTSGLGGRYLPGYPVGEIVRILHPGDESFAVIEVKPEANLERGRHVLLVEEQKSLKGKELNEDLKSTTSNKMILGTEELNENKKVNTSAKNYQTAKTNQTPKINQSTKDIKQTNQSTQTNQSSQTTQSNKADLNRQEPQKLITPLNNLITGNR